MNLLWPSAYRRDFPISTNLADLRTVIMLLAVGVRPFSDVQLLAMESKARRRPECLGRQARGCQPGHGGWAYSSRSDRGRTVAATDGRSRIRPAVRNLAYPGRPSGAVLHLLRETALDQVAAPTRNPEALLSGQCSVV